MTSVQSVPSAALMMNSNASAAPLSNLRGDDMATEFESLVIGQLLKTMRTSSEDGGMFPGDKSDTYGGMFDMYFGKFLAENGGLGLAEFVEKGMKS
jgi:flagellar protein FlgJ